MTLRIKQFIEENKQYIQNEDWYGLFFSWYQHWSGPNYVVDNELLKELIDILKTVFPNILNDSFKARSEIIVDKMCEYFYHIQNDTTTEVVTAAITTRNLKSRLLIDRTGLDILFHKAVKSCGFELANSLSFILER